MLEKRILALNKNTHSGDCVIYVMSRDQRVADNHALLAAQQEAMNSELPLVVAFNLLEKTGHRTREQYQFMLDGLQQVQSSLAELNISFVLLKGSFTKNISNLQKSIKAQSVYFDFNPLKGVRLVQKKIVKEVEANCFVVDTHNIIPLWVLSDKEEFAAHTIRNKVHKNLEEWLLEPTKPAKHPYGFEDKPEGIAWSEADEFVSTIEATGVKLKFKSGEAEATKRLSNFISCNLDEYAVQRNIPDQDGQSDLSPYLHFGQISSLRVALELLKQTSEPPLLFVKAKLASFEGEPTKQDSINALLEELIVRKELADNYCFYNPNYINIDGAKPWAIKTLNDHTKDDREYIYSLEEWEQANIHDEAWNAAQSQMMKTGKMHGYMRMYWAKKILEWSKSPEEAIETAVCLNDKYSIDGGDPNGYTGIMWSITGLHDRPWFERDVYGKIRYMNAGGLKRKFDLESYISKWMTE